MLSLLHLDPKLFRQPCLGSPQPDYLTPPAYDVAMRSTDVFCTGVEKVNLF